MSGDVLSMPESPLVAPVDTFISLRAEPEEEFNLADLTHSHFHARPPLSTPVLESMHRISSPLEPAPYASDAELNQDFAPLPPPPQRVTIKTARTLTDQQELQKPKAKTTAGVGSAFRLKAATFENTTIFEDLGNKNQPSWVGRLHHYGTDQYLFIVRRIRIVPQDGADYVIAAEVENDHNQLSLRFWFLILPTADFGDHTVAPAMLTSKLRDPYTKAFVSRNPSDMNTFLRTIHTELWLRWRAVFSGQDQITKTTRTSVVKEEITERDPDGSEFVISRKSTITSESLANQLYKSIVAPAMTQLHRHAFAVSASQYLSYLLMGSAWIVDQPDHVRKVLDLNFDDLKYCPGCVKVEETLKTGDFINVVLTSLSTGDWIGSSCDCAHHQVLLANLCHQFQCFKLFFGMNAGSFQSLIFTLCSV